MNTINPPLNQNEQWLQAIFQQSPDAIVIHELDGTIVNANDAFTRLSGMTLNKLAGKKITDLLPPDMREKWNHDIDKLIQGQWTLVQTFFFNATGQRIPFDISLIAHPVCSKKDVVILHFHNISVYHIVERALVAAREEWEQSFNAITDSICILDRSGKIIRANQAMKQKCRLDYPDITGRNYDSIFKVSEHRGSLTKLPDAIKASPYTIDEISFQNIDGWFQVSSYPLEDKQKNVMGALLIIRDITEHILIKETLTKNETALRQASKMEAIGRMAGGITHDFNNMLTSILGYTSLILQDMKPDDPMRNNIQEITNSAERAAALIRQLMDISHDRPLQTTVVNMNTVIEKMYKLLRTTLDTNIELVTRLDNALGNVKADVSRLEQIIINLAINANDAMPNGGKFIISTSNTVLDKQFCNIHPAYSEGNYVLLEVTDTGHGMPPDVMEHIFEPFYTTKEKGKGTGLGLTAIYSVIQQFKGYLSCNSEVNKGTTFKIHLPQIAKT